MHSKTLSFIDIAQSMQIILSKIVHKPNLTFFASSIFSLEKWTFIQTEENTLYIFNSTIDFFFVFNKIKYRFLNI